MTTFSDNHQRVLATGIHDIHHRLERMEALFDRAPHNSRFGRVRRDLSPGEVSEVRSYFRELRETMRDCLARNEVPLSAPEMSLRRTLQTRTAFLQVALTELSPDRLLRYGPLQEDARAELLLIQQQLEEIVDRLGAFLNE